MKKFVWIFLLFLVISFVSADSASYNLLNSGVVEVQINLDSPGEISLPETYSELESSAPYQLNDSVLYFENPTIITFSTKSYSDESSSERLFILPKFSISKIDVTVLLPEGSFLSDDLIFPKNYEISTNGNNIIFSWNDFNVGEIILFYRDSSPGSFGERILFYFLIILLAFVFYFQKKRHKRKLNKVIDASKNKINKLKEKEGDLITKNLFGDEKKILKYLLSQKDNSSWTKNMVNDLKIPKVRLSRKLRSLSEKGLIKREPHGNENRVILIKK